MAKTDPLFMTKTGKKHTLWAAHTYIAREYPRVKKKQALVYWRQLVFKYSSIDVGIVLAWVDVRLIFGLSI